LEDNKRFHVCAIYQFRKTDDLESLQKETDDFLEQKSIRGTILIAREGINGTVSGRENSINDFLVFLSQKGFKKLSVKKSVTSQQPFLRRKVKIKDEIVTMGLPDINPLASAGTYIKSQDWNKMITDPDVILIDTRNEYEIKVGTFPRAINPRTKTFREFPNFARRYLRDKTDKKIAMFCTGGIRCEKSTSFLRENGFENVFHLEGGILKYLEEVPAEESLWNGECFVFDNRVTVDQSLHKGSYEQCHACRTPISEEDKLSQDFTKGVSCPHCIDTKTDHDRSRFEERQKQINLAAQRNETHVGEEAKEDQKNRKREKKERLEKISGKHVTFTKGSL